jgi:WD40 repeat protein
VRVWEISESTVGSPLVLEGHGALVWSVAFARDGKRVASGSADTFIRIWDTTGVEPMQLQLCGHTNVVASVAFSPDGERVVSGSFDKTVRIWVAATGAQVALLEGHIHWVTFVRFSSSGEEIISQSTYDTTVRIWDSSTGEQLKVDEAVRYQRFFFKCSLTPTSTQECAPHHTLNLVQLLPDGFVERLDGYQVSWLPHEHRGVMAWSETTQRIALGASTGVVTIVDIAKPRSVMKVRNGFASERYNSLPDSESTSRIAFRNFPWALSQRA